MFVRTREELFLVLFFKKNTIYPRMPKFILKKAYKNEKVILEQDISYTKGEE